MVLHLRAQGLEEADEQPLRSLVGTWLALPFTLPRTQKARDATVRMRLPQHQQQQQEDVRARVCV